MSDCPFDVGHRVEWTDESTGAVFRGTVTSKDDLGDGSILRVQLDGDGEIPVACSQVRAASG